MNRIDSMGYCYEVEDMGKFLGSAIANCQDYIQKKGFLLKSAQQVRIAK